MIKISIYAVCCICADYIKERTISQFLRYTYCYLHTALLQNIARANFISFPYKLTVFLVVLFETFSGSLTVGKLYISYACEKHLIVTMLCQWNLINKDNIYNIKFMKSDPEKNIQFFIPQLVHHILLWIVTFKLSSYGRCFCGRF